MNAAVSLESVAIVNATYPEVNRRHSTITLRMWHHLANHPERDTLFGGYGSGNGGQPSTLVQALMDTIPLLAAGRWPRLRAAPGLRQEHWVPLERAFGDALVDVIGRTAVPMVVNAWCDMLHTFLGELQRQSGGADTMFGQPGQG